MEKRSGMRGKTPLVVILTAMLVAVSAPHTAEDFEFGTFARLGIPDAFPGAALGLVLTMQIVGVYLVARESRIGFAILAAAGVVWCVGALVIHGPEIVASGVYRHGLISKALEVAVILLGAAAAAAGAVEWRSRRSAA